MVCKEENMICKKCGRRIAEKGLTTIDKLCMCEEPVVLKEE